MTRRTIVASAFGVVLSLASIAAQDPPPPPGQTGQQQRKGANQPIVRPNAQAARGLGPMEIQNHMDGYALVQAQTALELTSEQTPNFVARYMTLQQLRRRYNQARLQMMRELRPLVQNAGPNRDELLVERLKALDDLTSTSTEEIRKAHMNLDAVLNPVQRVRFRFLEEEFERKKIELLGTLNQGRGRGVQPEARPNAGRGGGD